MSDYLNSLKCLKFLLNLINLLFSPQQCRVLLTDGAGCTTLDGNELSYFERAISRQYSQSLGKFKCHHRAVTVLLWAFLTALTEQNFLLAILLILTV